MQMAVPTGPGLDEIPRSNCYQGIMVSCGFFINKFTLQR